MPFSLWLLLYAIDLNSGMHTSGTGRGPSRKANCTSIARATPIIGRFAERRHPAGGGTGEAPIKSRMRAALDGRFDFCR